jgi:hypothetical protein
MLSDLLTTNIALFKFIVSCGTAEFVLVVIWLLKLVDASISFKLGPVVLALWVDNLEAT